LNQTSTNPNKKQFGEKLSNELLRNLLNFMLILALREFKKLVKNYFARISRERAKRKAQKIKARFNLVEGVAEDAAKAARYAQALAKLDALTSGNLPI